jgi:hypothetical protein
MSELPGQSRYALPATLGPIRAKIRLSSDQGGWNPKNSVPSGSRGVRDRLRSFNFCMGCSPSVHISADGCSILPAALWHLPQQVIRAFGAHCLKLTFQHAPSLPVQSVGVASRCALVSRTDRWDARLGGLDDRNKLAQGQPRGC